MDRRGISELFTINLFVILGVVTCLSSKTADGCCPKLPAPVRNGLESPQIGQSPWGQSPCPKSHPIGQPCRGRGKLRLGAKKPVHKKTRINSRFLALLILAG